MAREIKRRRGEEYNLDRLRRTEIAPATSKAKAADGSGTSAPSAGGLLSGVAPKFPASALKSEMLTVPS